MIQSEQINEIATALAKAQGEMKNAAFDAKNPHFGNRYATLAAILDVVRPALSKNGIAVVQAKELNGTGLHLVTRFIHTSGQWLGDVHPLPDPTMVKPQEFGSQLTYAKRYSLSTLAGVSADEDEDAEIAQKAQTVTKKYGTTPTDIIGEPIETDEQGNPIDNIPLGDPSIEKLRVKDARPEYALLSSEIRKIQSLPALEEWGQQNANRVASLTNNWQEMLRGEYRDKRNDLKSNAGLYPKLKPKPNKDAEEPHEFGLGDSSVDWRWFASVMIGKAKLPNWKEWEDANRHNMSRMVNEDPKSFDLMVAGIKGARPADRR